MQNINRIFIVNFIIFFILFLQSVNCQADSEKLIFADSLFKTGSFKEAYQEYQNILQEDNSYSPAMLLRMAYIAEGMGQFNEATFYLSKYYDYNPNSKIISKIKSLTSQSELKGYEVSDRAQFFKILTNNQQTITGVLALLLVLSLILNLSRKNQDQPKYYIPIMILLILVFLSNNFLESPKKGVIKGNPTVIMDQPTAGGNLIKKVGPGHRVTIDGSTDIWYHIKWDGKKAYVKKDKVAEI
ncbi:SH3 domain-containing protein [Echinicola jeungdonensis]|uniref:SH3 domain-containing protein n=1 Tax=Echinicola jeungdonensis TaxID=709343 RepID=A0ABV5J4Z0_9BACT|nr:SH3 domain-containing protein [Echinicola jeungdonensis]MDN3669626.1 SH3 domain-containing protein [Echinicola jeungdonensis]